MFILLFDPNAFNILSYNTHDTSNKPLGKKKYIHAKSKYQVIQIKTLSVKISHF